MCFSLLTLLVLVGLVGWVSFHLHIPTRLWIRENVNDLADWIKSKVN